MICIQAGSPDCWLPRTFSAELGQFAQLLGDCAARDGPFNIFRYAILSRNIFVNTYLRISTLRKSNPPTSRFNACEVNGSCGPMKTNRRRAIGAFIRFQSFLFMTRLIRFAIIPVATIDVRLSKLKNSNHKPTLCTLFIR